MFWCKLGIHKWSKWTDPEMNDVQVRRCTHCNLVECRVVLIQIGENFVTDMGSPAANRYRSGKFGY